jgi:hypothetical protein
MGKYASLKDYPRRELIWLELPEIARSGFVAATLVDLTDELTSNKLSYNDLESELRQAAQSKKMQQHLISSITIPLTKKLRLFDILPGLSDNHTGELIRSHKFSTPEAEAFGRLVSKNRWKAIAEWLYNNRVNRSDLVPALFQCTHLLGFWERFMLSASGLKPDAISREEWWNEFLETSLKLFPGGPEQNGLWMSAGGDLSRLSTNGTGRDKWSIATRILRYNGSPTIERLVEKMREEYPGNEQLKNLQDTL